MDYLFIYIYKFVYLWFFDVFSFVWGDWFEIKERIKIVINMCFEIKENLFIVIYFKKYWVLGNRYVIWFDKNVESDII